MLRSTKALLAVVTPLLVGCVSGYRGLATETSPTELRSVCGATSVEGVPFIEQAGREDCGTAALAMIFAYWQIPMGREDVLAACPTEPGVGTKAAAMRDLARANGLQVWLIKGELADLEHELERGRPVLVGLAQACSDATWSHYAVVVGVSRLNDRIVTVDPARGWQKNTVRGFLDEWEPANRLSMVFLRPPPTASTPSSNVSSSEIKP
jgi:ABC-type bacteriocin/lantibiotic exporter with double-glycine peptidase domain